MESNVSQSLRFPIESKGVNIIALLNVSIIIHKLIKFLIYLKLYYI